MVEVGLLDRMFIDVNGKLLNVVMVNNYDEVKNLLENGVNFNFVIFNLIDGMFMLFYFVVWCNKVDIVWCMFEFGVDVNFVDEDGSLFLFLVVYKIIDLEICNFLLGNGINVDYINNVGNIIFLYMFEGYVLEGLEFDLEVVF